MLDGKEVEGKLGELGAYSVDVTGDGHLEVQLGVRVDLVAELEKLCAKTSTPIDDAALKWVKALLGRV